MTKPAPYPADTRAKGWRFELDHERIRQSDTWALAAPEIRPWLLMLWMTAWEQTPCGSLPDDDELIAARIGMPLDQFQACKPRLLRGWWQADDGRLYHGTMTERVLEMIERRDGERLRKAAYRAAKEAERAAAAQGKKPSRGKRASPGVSPGTPEMSHGTDAGQTAESHRKDNTGTGTGTGTIDYVEPDGSTVHGDSPASSGDASRLPRALGIRELVAEGVERQHAEDWLKVRRAKGAPLTSTAWDAVKREASAAGITPPEAVRISAENAWQGFKASWLERARQRDGPPQSVRGKSAAQQRADWLSELDNELRGKPREIDMGTIDATSQR